MFKKMTAEHWRKQINRLVKRVSSGVGGGFSQAFFLLLMGETRLDGEGFLGIYSLVEVKHWKMQRNNSSGKLKIIQKDFMSHRQVTTQPLLNSIRYRPFSRHPRTCSQRTD